MANPVMNYNQFMSKFKSAEKGYSGKGNTKNADSKTDSKIDQEMVEGPVKGSGTAPISKYTKEHLANIKKKDNAKGGSKK